MPKEELKIPLPQGIELRSQNRECNKKQCLCAVYLKKSLVCLEINPHEEDGQKVIYTMRPCSKSQTQKIEIEG